MNSSLNRRIEEPIELAIRYIETVTGILIPDYRYDIVQEALREIGTGDEFRGLNRVLAEEPAAKRRLFDAVSIAETYFFRHAGHFEALRLYAAEKSRAKQDCHVLSAGCSTGEEAWSAAAVLASIYLPNANFSVTGWELSAERVAFAQAGVYRSWSLRKPDCEMMRYLVPRGSVWEVHPGLRPFVRFQSVNLHAEHWPVRPYDAVFFRNVSIYWTRAQAAEIAERLAAMLPVGGLFFAGPSDPVSFARSGWDMQTLGDATVYRKREKSAPRRPAVTVRRMPETIAPPPLPAPAGPSFFEQVAALADEGRYGEALALLEEGQGKPPAEVKYWQGVLLLNLDRAEEAVQAFRFCVYLAPQEPSYRRWLATALEAAGLGHEAARETRNAEQLEKA